MSIGYKGLNYLKNQINRINLTLRNNNMVPHDDYVSYDYYGEACNDGSPPGFPYNDKVLLASSLTNSADNILVNFEWDDGIGTIHTFCQCFAKHDSTHHEVTIPNPVYGPPGTGSYGLTTSSNPRPWITSIVPNEECGQHPCTDCMPGGCTIVSAPTGVIKFTTSAAIDGIVDSITTTETYGDSWNGMNISIVRLSDNNVEATYTGPPSCNTPPCSQTEPQLTLLPSTEYGIYINDSGAYPWENGLIIDQDGANLLTISQFANLTGHATCEWYQ